MEGRSDGMPKVNVYMETDNGSKGTLYRGYGAVVEFVRRDGTVETRMVSGMCHGDWNLAYMHALTEALGLLSKPCTVIMVTNNDYVCKSLCSGRVNEWRMNGWRTAAGRPVAYADEWRELSRAASGHTLYFVHAGGKRPYSSEIQGAISEVRGRGERWQQMQLAD